MTTLTGKFVNTFSEATHALVTNMPVNADYPFMRGEIKEVTGDQVTIIGRGGQEATFKAEMGPVGMEYGWLEQVSTFERITGAKPKPLQMFPFAAN